MTGPFQAFQGIYPHQLDESSVGKQVSWCVDTYV